MATVLRCLVRATRGLGGAARRGLALALATTVLGLVLPDLAPPAAAQSVSGVSVSVSPSTGGSTDAKYTVGLTAATALTVGEGLYLQAPAGTAFPTVASDVYLNSTVAATVRVTGGNLIEIDSPVAVAAGGFVSAVVHGVANPAVGSYSLSAYTSADTTPVTSSTYRIVAPVAITTGSLPAGTLGQPYTPTTMQASGGLLNCGGCYDWYASGLPAGMFLDTGSGILSGRPSQGGAFTVTVTAEDQASPPNSASTTLTLTVRSALTGVAVTVSPEAAGATDAQYTVAFTAPSGLAVSQAVYIAAPGGTVFPAPASDYTIDGTAASSVAGGGGDAVQITAAAPVAAGAAVSVVIQGVTNPAGGSHTLSVDTSADTTVVTSSSYTIIGTFAITTSALPAGTLGQPYPPTRLQATGGVLVAPCACYQSWQASGLPPGMSMDPGSGMLTGTPAQSGTFHVTISVQDQASPPDSTSATLTLTVSSAVTGVAVTVSPDAAGATDAQYTVGFTTASGLTVGQAVYIAAPGGTVFPPPASDYTIDGTAASSVAGGGGDAVQITAAAPVAAGAAVSVVIQGVTNPAGGSHTLSVDTSADTVPVASAPYTILQPLTITTGSLPAATVGQPYTARVAASGGILTATTGVCCYSWSASGLPAGLTFDPGSAVISGTPSAAGDFPVQVTVADQATPAPASVTKTLSLSVLPGALSPVVQSLQPASGPAAGGTTVTLTGTNLSGASAVDFGGVAASFTIVSDTELAAVAPPGSGAVAVTVASPHGTSAGVSYTYGPTLSSLSVAYGSPAGGTRVGVFGGGFIAGQTEVAFGTAAATAVQVVSASELQVTAPPGHGTVDVTVTTPGGTTAQGAQDRFGYLPVVAEVAPDLGRAGNQVTIYGLNLAVAQAVYFGSAPATDLKVVADRELQLTVPPGTGRVPVTVVSAGGTSAATARSEFSYPQATGAVDVRFVDTYGTRVMARPYICSETTDACVVGQVEWQQVLTLPVGTYLIYANAPEGESYVWSGEGVINITPGTLSRFDVIFQAPPPIPRNVSIHGFACGAGICGFTWTSVSFTSCPNGTAIWSLTTDGTTWWRGRAIEQPYASGRYVASIPPVSRLRIGWSYLAMTMYCGPRVAATTTYVAFYIDPGGRVQTPAGVPVAGATVTLNQADAFGGPFAAVPDGSAVMSPANRTNPVTTDATGVFSWDVLPGYYQITAQKAGCTVPGDPTASVAQTPVLAVPPPADGLVLTLDCPAASRVASATTLVASSATVASGQPVLLTATVEAASGTLPTGLVTFLDGTTALGQAPVDKATGRAELAVSGLAAGLHLLTASYSGDANNAPSVSAVLAETATSDPLPAVSGISPANGGTAGGTWVTIRGTGFVLGGTAVDFGPGNPAPAAIVDSTGTSIQVDVPAGTGTVDVTVTTAGGTSATSASDRFTYVTQASGAGTVAYAPAPAPTVTGIAPASGPAAGGTAVTITGGGLTGATAVDFGATHAESFQVTADGQVTAVSPPGTGTVDVTVTTSYGISATGAADRFTYVQPTSQTTPAVTFADVPAGYWAQAAIGTLAARGIAGGFPDGTFRPGAPVTRAEFVKMLDLTLGLKVGSTATTFADVPASSWYAPYVAAAVAGGLTDGTTPTTFSPDGTMTREQMAVLLARALKLTRTQSLTFTDAAAIGGWALQAVEEAVAAGYLSGFPGGSFQPLAPATRAQAAAVLAKVLAAGGQP